MKHKRINISFDISLKLVILLESTDLQATFSVQGYGGSHLVLEQDYMLSDQKYFIQI